MSVYAANRYNLLSCQDVGDVIVVYNGIGLSGYPEAQPAMHLENMRWMPEPFFRQQQS